MPPPREMCMCAVHAYVWICRKSRPQAVWSIKLRSLYSIAAFSTQELNAENSVNDLTTAMAAAATIAERMSSN